MKKFEKAQFIKNVGSSWSALAVNVLVGIFLSPYILHHLGDTAFGLWILIFSTTGYYGLFDLGIRSSIIRYVARYSATDSKEELNRLANTALFGYCAIGLVTMAITLILSHYVSTIFRIPADFVRAARWLLLMVGASVSLGFPLGLFGGILEGLQRFYLMNLTRTSSYLLRAFFIVLALRHGQGLLTVAFITVTLPLLASLVNVAAVYRVLPIQLGAKYVSRSSLRQIASYSGSAFLIIVAQRLRFNTDAVVIGTFVSAAAVTYFTIGSRLVEYSWQIVDSLAQIFVPMSTQSHAKGDIDGLRKILIVGNRASAFIIFPITAVLTILGKSIIEVWVGSKYVATSYPVLLVLLYPMTLMLAQSASLRTLWGMAKHRTWGWVVLVEGVSNLILSIILVRLYGIMGDAVGTAIPLTCSMILFLPGHLCRLLQIRIGTYLYGAFLLPFALCIPLVSVLLLMRRWFIPHGLKQLVLQAVIGAIVYGIGLGWAFWTRRAWDVGHLGTNQEDELTLALVEKYQEEV